MKTSSHNLQKTMKNSNLATYKEADMGRIKSEMVNIIEIHKWLRRHSLGNLDIFSKEYNKLVTERFRKHQQAKLLRESLTPAELEQIFDYITTHAL